MQTLTSIGEIIEAIYEEVLETYRDRELALVVAQALGDELLAEAKRGKVPAPRRFVLGTEVTARPCRVLLA